MIHVDGAAGGGQILRSALSLAVLTGTPVRVERIRMKRDRPGLMRQHLMAAQAAAAICDGELTGAELGSTTLTLRPGPVRPGRHHFAIATAGSTSLVLQTVLPPLLTASGASQLSFEGGTHNQLAPPYCFLARVFFPLLARMGPQLTSRLVRHGFYPAGGGRVELEVQPRAQLQPLTLLERGPRLRLSAEVLSSNLPGHIAARELEVVVGRLALSEPPRIRETRALGPGNVVQLFAEHAGGLELVTGFGAPRKQAERVATEACDQLQRYLDADVPVGEHLADQLLLPLAMAGSGSFRTLPLSDHARSNIAVIEQFLPVRFALREERATCVVQLLSA